MGLLRVDLETWVLRQVGYCAELDDHPDGWLWYCPVDVDGRNPEALQVLRMLADLCPVHRELPEWSEIMVVPMTVIRAWRWQRRLIRSWRAAMIPSHGTFDPTIRPRDQEARHHDQRHGA